MKTLYFYMLQFFLAGDKYWNIAPDSRTGATEENDLFAAYNKIADIAFGYVLPIFVGIGCFVALFFAVKAGIKISAAQTGEEKQAGKKQLMGNIAGIFIIISAQFIVPLIVKGIYSAVR